MRRRLWINIVVVYHGPHTTHTQHHNTQHTTTHNNSQKYTTTHNNNQHTTRTHNTQHPLTLPLTLQYHIHYHLHLHLHLHLRLHLHLHLQIQHWHWYLRVHAVHKRRASLKHTSRVHSLWVLLQNDTYFDWFEERLADGLAIAEPLSRIISLPEEKLQKALKSEPSRQVGISLESTFTIQTRLRYVSVMPSTMEDLRTKYFVLTNMWCHFYLDLTRGTFGDFLDELVSHRVFVSTTSRSCVTKQSVCVRNIGRRVQQALWMAYARVLHIDRSFQKRVLELKKRLKKRSRPQRRRPGQPLHIAKGYLSFQALLVLRAAQKGTGG